MDISGKCGSCEYWKDFSDRVFAIISEGHSRFHRNRIELRRCRFTPPPTVSDVVHEIYTDCGHTCSGFTDKGTK